MNLIIILYIILFYCIHTYILLNALLYKIYFAIV